MIKQAGEAVLRALQSSGQTSYGSDLERFLAKLNSSEFETKKIVVEQLRKFCASERIRGLEVGKLTAAEWGGLLDALDADLQKFMANAEQTRISKLKDSTGASTAICKKALVKTDWNVDKAREVIDKSGHGKKDK